MIRSTVILTKNQRSILQIALEIARDKFEENARLLSADVYGQTVGLKKQFEYQADEAEILLNQVTLADEIAIVEEV